MAFFDDYPTTSTLP
jgi:hypothetical protein